MTKLLNLLYYFVCLIAALAANLPEDWLNVLAFLPVAPHTRQQIRLALTAIVLAAAWIKSHWNLFVNPDGTPAQASWVKK